MKKLIMLTGVVAFLILSASAASACMCTTIGSPKTNLAKLDAVFQGEIRTASLHDGKREWTMIVDRVWKGDIEERIKLRGLSSPDSSCAFNFKLKGKYIIFAYAKRSKGKVVYYPAVCTWTTPLGKYRFGDKLAEEYIYQELGEGRLPIKRASERQDGVRSGNISYPWRSITTHSTGARDSMAFIILPSIYLECLSPAPG